MSLLPTTKPGRTASNWLGLRPDRDPRLSLGDAAFHRFADALSDATSPRAVADALVRIAHEASGAPRAELVRERSWGANRLASWPSGETGTSTRRTLLPVFGEGQVEGRSLSIGIPARHAGRTIATLWLYDDQPRVWPAELVRLLTSLATLAASSGFAPDETTEPLTTPSHDLATSLPNAAFLEAFLNYAVAQAKRKHETISLLCVGIDGMASLRERQPDDQPLAHDAERLVGWTMAATLRASDLVARLDDGRIVAALPNARFDDALLIADTVRNAIAEVGHCSAPLPVIHVSVGVVSYPEHAQDAAGLLVAASSALVEARRSGQIYGPPVSPGGGHLRVVDDAD